MTVDRENDTLPPRTPVLIGCGQYVDRGDDPARAPSPQDMLAQVARAAAQDTGATADLLAAADTVAVIRLFADSAPTYKSPFGGSTNYPRSLANRIGASPRRLIYPHVGGNTPQYMVNVLAEAIAAGETDIAVLAGCEVMRTVGRARKAGIQLDWQEDIDEAPEVVGDGRIGVSPYEMRHGIGEPSGTYPLYENALQAHYHQSSADHRAALGRLFAPFTQVAAANPFAQVPVARSAEEIATITEANRIIAWPYTKFMNANIAVDQAAAIILTSVEKARALGVPRDKWVFLRGCADTTEKWFMSDRVDYHSAPAIRVGAARALAAAGVGIDDVSDFDIYSCFPCAVEIACDEIGLAHDDPRGLTVTGGLPYFGGPGNNYSLHGIAGMMDRLRARPGGLGLVTANGWYLTKQSFGVYATEPGDRPFERTDPAGYQGEIDALPSPSLAEQADGPATIETYSVVFDRSGPRRGIVIGRLDDTGARFLANTPKDDAAQMRALMADDTVGRPITVAHHDGINVATLDGV